MTTQQADAVTNRVSRAPWAQDAPSVLRAFDVAPERGLDADAVAEQRRRFGPNLLRETRRLGTWRILADQFRSLVVLLLAVAAAVSFVFDSWIEGWAIVAVLAINAGIGFATELRAVRSMEALRRLGSVRSRVLRGGEVRTIPAEELVPGDVVPLEQGDVVTADLRLVEASLLEADESTLTGESMPVAKDVAPVPADTPVADRAPMLFKGTSITRGAGAGVVVATGMNSELGRIARLTQEAEHESTPLERRLDRLARRLIWVALCIAALTVAVGLVTGREILLMVETGIALSVAAIPEGLPIVATLALARGLARLARRHALINRLAAVETLGATTLIFTDKTGTLTENRMTLEELWLPSGRAACSAEAQDDVPADAQADIRAALELGVLCNNASLAAPMVPEEAGDASGDERDERATGDPLEIALLAAGAAAGVDRGELLASRPEVREEAFDRSTQMMATVHQAGETYLVAVKGAAERVLAASTRVRSAEGGEATEDLDEARRNQWLERNHELAEGGMRVIGLAQKVVDDPSDDAYRDLVFVGLAALRDPPRRDVAAALAACRDAGIRVIMATGDHAGTAVAVAREVGLARGEEVAAVAGRDLPDLDSATDDERRRLRQVDVFARLAPDQKLDLIALHQQAGEVVAMTGDGVNDAPALRQAEIGIAMGRRGTQVAREAADMVLLDDDFASIVAAVEQGRVVFGNIRRFVYYLLSCNVSEILVVLGATLLQAPLPILPLQILFLNLVTDVFPALALGMGEGERTVMSEPPRPRREPVLTPRHWRGIAGYGTAITVSVLAALFWARGPLGYNDRDAVTISFLTLALAQLWHVFSMRDPGSSPWRNQVTENPWIWAAVALCLVLTVGAVYLPAVADVLGLHPPGWSGWAVAAGLSIVPWLVGVVALRRRSEPAPGTASSTAEP